MTAQEIQKTTSENDHLQQLIAYILRGWLKVEIKHHKKWDHFWAFRDKMAVINDIMLNGGWIVTPEELQKPGAESTA